MKYIWILLIVSFLKELIFSILVPIWHTPDEQAHFAEVAYFAEFNSIPLSAHTPKDLNREIFESEKLLGTLRDERGNNKFTFHPEYKIEYTKNNIGKYETAIKNFPIEYRKDLVSQESPNYPPLFYWLSVIPYKIFYSTDLITRIYLVRFISILLGVASVYICWKIAQKIFPENPNLQIGLSTMYSFQPMSSFVFSGVNSDNLFNFLFTLFIYLCVLFIIDKINKRIILSFILVFLLLYLTKPQFILTIPIFLTALGLKIILQTKFSWKILGSLLSVILALGIFIGWIIQDREHIQLIERFYPQSFFPGLGKLELSPIVFFKETLRHTIAEVIPWYWGVFDWLGVTYPRDVHRVINRIMILSGAGVLIALYKILRKRKKEDYLFVFMILISIIYFLGITFYNFLFAKNHGFPFGIQGRYYFPILIAEMVILLIGLTTLVPDRFVRIKFYWIKIIPVLMIILNAIALYTIASTYYDLSSGASFISQASQYKPVFLKGNNLIGIFIGYILTLFLFLYRFLKLR